MSNYDSLKSRDYILFISIDPNKFNSMFNYYLLKKRLHKRESYSFSTPRIILVKVDMCMFLCCKCIYIMTKRRFSLFPGLLSWKWVIKVTVIHTILFSFLEIIYYLVNMKIQGNKVSDVLIKLCHHLAHLYLPINVIHYRNF